MPAFVLPPTAFFVPLVGSLRLSNRQTSWKFHLVLAQRQGGRPERDSLEESSFLGDKRLFSFRARRSYANQTGAGFFQPSCQAGRSFGISLGNLFPTVRDDPKVKKGIVSPELAVPAHIQRPPYARPGAKRQNLMGMGVPIDIKGPSAVAKMRASGALAAKILYYAGTLVKPGISTDELDQAVHDYTVWNGAYPSPLNYDGFPKSVCTSVNEVVCHGIPDSRPLQEGDIVNIDVTCYLNGFHGDTNATFFVGQVDEQSRRLVETTREALSAAIDICGPGQKFSKIGDVISEIAERDRFGIVAEYCGHGIGSEFHTDPCVYHVRNESSDVMQPGMTFTIEPMLTEKSRRTAVWPDNWTVVTVDGGRSAQFEHTLLITEDGCDVLTMLTPELIEVVEKDREKFEKARADGTVRPARVEPSNTLKQRRKGKGFI